MNIQEQLKELYALKGELRTQIEIAQARLQPVDQEIVKILNQAASNGKAVDDSKKDSKN